MRGVIVIINVKCLAHIQGTWWTIWLLVVFYWCWWPKKVWYKQFDQTTTSNYITLQKLRSSEAVFDIVCVCVYVFKHACTCSYIHPSLCVNVQWSCNSHIPLLQLCSLPPFWRYHILRSVRASLFFHSQRSQFGPWLCWEEKAEKKLAHPWLWVQRQSGELGAKQSQCREGAGSGDWRAKTEKLWRAFLNNFHPTMKENKWIKFKPS